MRNVALGAAVLYASIVSAQARLGETIEVSIVSLDAVVTDRSGNHVRGLTAADFEIRERGRDQPITHFAEYRSGVSGAPPAPDAGAGTQAPARPPRNLVVFLEPVRLLPREAQTVYGGLRKLMHEMVEAGDRAAIVTWRGDLQIRQPFTDDAEALSSVLSELEREAVESAPNLAAATRRQQQDIVQHDLEAAAFAREMGFTVPSTPQNAVPVQSLLSARQQLAEIRKKADAVETLLYAISGLDGRKIVILGLRRFGVRAGAEFFEGQIPVDYRRELDTARQREQLIRTANAHGIALYPVYAGGLPWDPGDDALSRNRVTEGEDDRLSLQNRILLNETSALEEMAVRTGGTMAWGSTNISAMLPGVADDAGSYYSLAYRTPSSGKDVSRDIVVRVKNPEYRVRTRTQFVEKSDRTLMHDRVRAALFHPLGGAGLAFDVIVGQVRNAGRSKWAVPVELRIPIAALATRAEGPQETGEFSVYVVTAGAAGAISEVERRSQPFRIRGADLERARASYYTYELTVLIGDGANRLSIGVLDETSKEFGLRRVSVPGRLPR